MNVNDLIERRNTDENLCVESRISVHAYLSLDCRTSSGTRVVKEL